MNPSILRDTLPGFHETPQYLAQYDEVLKTPAVQELIKDSVEVRALVQFIEECREFAYVLENA